MNIDYCISVLEELRQAEEDMRQYERALKHYDLSREWRKQVTRTRHMIKELTILYEKFANSIDNS